MFFHSSPHAFSFSFIIDVVVLVIVTAIVIIVMLFLVFLYWYCCCWYWVNIEDTVPELIYTFIEQNVRPGPLISLKCSASGSPPPQVS